MSQLDPHLETALLGPPACKNCWWFSGDEHGECRRRAPQAMIVEEPEGEAIVRSVMTVWPGVSAKDRCGEYENRVVKDAELRSARAAALAQSDGAS